MNIYPQSITDKECHHRVVHAFNKFCFNFSENSYATKYAYVLANLCEMGIKACHIEAVMKEHCAEAGTKTIRGIV
ncbi:unnamed protein product [Meloidogyne enterolobii]|uniref:Uncharacterized protein n=1 Tax=Meloidogyne enterolobii TaxID=390850 RepID=A0ACB0XUR2_MELEN